MNKWAGTEESRDITGPSLRKGCERACVSAQEAGLCEQVCDIKEEVDVQSND